MAGEPKRNRVIRVEDSLWERATKKAAANNETVSKAVRNFLERYAPMYENDLTVLIAALDKGGDVTLTDAELEAASGRAVTMWRDESGNLRVRADEKPAQ